MDPSPEVISPKRRGRPPKNPHTITAAVIKAAESASQQRISAELATPKGQSAAIKAQGSYGLPAVIRAEFVGQLRLTIDSQSSTWPAPQGFGSPRDQGEMLADLAHRGLIFRAPGSAWDVFIPFEQVKLFHVKR